MPVYTYEPEAKRWRDEDTNEYLPLGATAMVDGERMQLNSDGSLSAIHKDEPLKFSDYFTSWFDKDQWKGNLNDAAENSRNSLDENQKEFKKGHLNFRKGNYFNMAGHYARGINNTIGGTIGAAIQAMLPRKIEKATAFFGPFLKPQNWVNSAMGTAKAVADLTPFYEVDPDTNFQWSLPWDEDNEGFASNNFNFIPLTKEDRENINDITDAAVSLVATKGALGGLKTGMNTVKSVGKAAKTGAKKGPGAGLIQMARTSKANLPSVMSHIPVISNGSLLYNTVGKAVLPKKMGGASTFKGRVSGAAQAIPLYGTGLQVFDPQVAAYPFWHTSILQNNANNHTDLYYNDLTNTEN